ncbi:MAG: hypothetical protein HQM10_17970 [Candidatus Riflebacteria bacterium]|nr:hypothetical protein [Candidatus Riflebacteria bacterium]
MNECFEIEKKQNSVTTFMSNLIDSNSERNSLLQEMLLPIFCALLAAFLSWLILSQGIKLTPDGWGYWEGSVSILSGHGYKYFGGQAILSFPPLFSLYLSVIQGITGVSGYSLMYSLSLLSAITAFCWSFLLICLTRGIKEIQFSRWVGSLYLSAFVGYYFTFLLSETLFLPILGLFFIQLRRVQINEKSINQCLPELVAVWFIMALMMLTRNSCIAFLPGLAFVVYLQHKKSCYSHQLFLSLMSFFIPLSIWFFFRYFMGATGSHEFSQGGKYSPLEYLIQFISDLCYRLGPTRFHIGTILLISVISAISVLWRPQNTAMHFLYLIALFAFSGTFGLFCMFNIMQIFDTLTDRFIWYLPMIFVTLLVACIAYSEGLRRTMLILLLCVITMCQILRTSNRVCNLMQTQLNANVSGDYTISPDYISRPPVHLGDRTLISPPDFAWIKRNPCKNGALKTF